MAWKDLSPHEKKIRERGALAGAILGITLSIIAWGPFGIIGGIVEIVLMTKGGEWMAIGTTELHHIRQVKSGKLSVAAFKKMYPRSKAF
jgi:hypothetical protein